MLSWQCDGKRPCSRCIRAHTECGFRPKAEYNRAEANRLNKELSKQNSELIEIIDSLQPKPQGVQHGTLERVGFNPESSGPIEFIDELRSLSMGGLNHNFLKSNWTPLERELRTRHPVAYPWNSLLEANDSTSHMAQAAVDSKQSGTSRLPLHLPVMLGRPEMSQGSRSMLLEHSVSFCDSRLHALDVGRWSNVQIKDAFAASAISFYLESEYPLLGCFDLDLFLDDLISGGTSFCSSLLVNSLLFRACVNHTDSFWPPLANISSANLYHFRH